MPETVDTHVWIGCRVENDQKDAAWVLDRFCNHGLSPRNGEPNRMHPWFFRNDYVDMMNRATPDVFFVFLFFFARGKNGFICTVFSFSAVNGGNAFADRNRHKRLLCQCVRVYRNLVLGDRQLIST